MSESEINDKLDRMSQGGRQAIYREMADGAPIGEIFKLNPIYRQQVVKLLKLDSEARFVLRLSEKGNKQLRSGETLDLRSADGGHLSFQRGADKPCSFRNAMHLFYTYGPDAPVELHRGLVECAGRSEAQGPTASSKKVDQENAKLRAELERVQARAFKLEADLKEKEGK